VLARGEVKVYKLLHHGRTATLRYVRPGDTFAESALSSDVYPAYTEATAPSMLYRSAVSDLRALLLDAPELALLARMSQLMLLNRGVEELLLPVPLRLARYLFELCDQQLDPPARAAAYSIASALAEDAGPAAGGLLVVRPPGSVVAVQSAPASAPGRGPCICRLPMTKRDLAARLGTVPETLSRALGSLKSVGVIRLSGNGELVEILDFDELARIARLGPPSPSAPAGAHPWPLSDR